MRKLATALAVSIALSSGTAQALSLGEIEMRSALNQPMNAEIRLSSVRAGELDGMIVKLASPEAFARAGIDRIPVLANLEFTVSEATQSIIITSRSPVVEPFLNFLLEVDWTSGRMVREYTVLLDPPVFLTPNTSARTDTLADSPAIVQRDDTSLVTPTLIQRDSQVIPGDIVSFDSDGGEAVSLDALELDAIGVAAGQRAQATGDAARSATDSLVGGDVIDLTSDIGGEVVTLSDLDTSQVGVPSSDGLFDGGEVVTLTDLGAPNTSAQTTFSADGLPDVQLFGGGSEAGDVVSGSEIVSLDNLSGTSSAGGTITVQRGDTLGEIAANAAGNGVSAQQMMMALLAANESAFINGNINLVKSGATLRIPDASEASRISQAEALAGINDQNRLWQEYRDSTRSGQRATQVAQAPTPAAEPNDSSGLTDQAAAILERARTEVLRREELSIVADSESTTTSASATSDESSENSDAAVGEINRRIQLAREELASSVRETEDLDDQAEALKDTGENLDTLVTLQQNDIAQLEASLEAAKSANNNALNGAQAAAGDAANAAGDALNGAGDALSGAANGAGDALSGVADGAGDALTGAADGAGNLIGGAADGLENTASNALSSAGEGLEAVELVGGDAADSVADSANAAAAATATAASNAGSAASDAAGESKGWLDGVMSSNLKWIPIGLGAIFGLGLLGTLFMGRRKRSDVDDIELDDVEFLDEMDSVGGAGSAAHAGADFDDEIDGVQSAASAGYSNVAGAGAAAAAGVAGAGAAVASGMGGNDDDYQSDEHFGATADAAHDANAGIEDLDHDDTISEVDVYLAYGLHGQAEELLTKAIDRDSDNAEYQSKLLETYAAQGNAEGYSATAEQFEQKFGASHPAWAGIAHQGTQLDPSNPLFSGAGAAGAAGALGVAGAAGAAASMGASQFDDTASSADDFANAADSADDFASISGDFAGVDGAAADDGDESHLMDQSIDPAFAFDEADLEATGDFSQIADEIAADVGDDTASLDFPSLDSAGDSLGSIAGSAKGAALGAAGAAAAGAAGIAGTVGDKASNAVNDMSLDMPELPDLDATSNLSGAAEDLTLDLNQLSGDMELDSTELLDDSIHSVDSLNLPTSDDTMLAGTDSLESVDEMDTMMDLAKAYIDMGDNDSASSALDEIVKSGSPQQVSEAETLKRKIS